MIAGYVVSCVYHPRRGVAKTMSGLRKVSGKSGWVWLGLLLPFAFQAVGGIVDFMIGGTEVLTLTAGALFFLVASYPFIFFFGGALNEEPGWRGFATPQFLEKYSPLAAGIIIGVIWSVWNFHFRSPSLMATTLAGLHFALSSTCRLGFCSLGSIIGQEGTCLLACCCTPASTPPATFSDQLVRLLLLEQWLCLPLP